MTPFYVPESLRDTAVAAFSALARARFASQGSLLAYAGPHGLTRELVDDWVATGLLHRGTVRPTPLAPPDLPYLALAPKGAQALEAATGARVESIPIAVLRRPVARRAHDVMVGEVVLAALALADDGAIDLAGVEADDRKLGTSAIVADPAPRRIPLQPDALVLVRRGPQPVATLVEVDRGTTSAVRLATKYLAYLAWQRDGGPVRQFGTKALRVLTLAPSEKRLARLHDAALAANGGQRSGFLVFALQDDVSVCTAERLLDPIAQPLGASPRDRVAVLPRASPPP